MVFGKKHPVSGKIVTMQTALYIALLTELSSQSFILRMGEEQQKNGKESCKKGSNCRIPRHIEYFKKLATRYAERIKVKMAKYLYKLATRYAERIKVKMAKYL